MCILMIDNKNKSLYYIVSYRTKLRGGMEICALVIMMSVVMMWEG